MSHLLNYNKLSTADKYSGSYLQASRLFSSLQHSPKQSYDTLRTFAPGANQMTLRHEDLTVEGIKQIYLDCDSERAKYDVLVKFYGLLTIGSSIIFVKVCGLVADPSLDHANIDPRLARPP